MCDLSLYKDYTNLTVISTQYSHSVA